MKEAFYMRDWMVPKDQRPNPGHHFAVQIDEYRSGHWVTVAMTNDRREVTRLVRDLRRPPNEVRVVQVQTTTTR